MVVDTREKGNVDLRCDPEGEESVNASQRGSTGPSLPSHPHHYSFSFVLLLFFFLLFFPILFSFILFLIFFSFSIFIITHVFFPVTQAILLCLFFFILIFSNISSTTSTASSSLTISSVNFLFLLLVSPLRPPHQP